MFAADYEPPGEHAVLLVVAAGGVVALRLQRLLDDQPRGQLQQRGPAVGRRQAAFDQDRQLFARAVLLKARSGPRKREATLGGKTALVPVSLQRSEPKPHRIQVRTMQPWQHYGRRYCVADASQADSISLSLQLSLVS